MFLPSSIAERALATARVGFLTSLFLLGSVGGCGGGTTGTSPSEGLRFNGFAEGADGTRAGALTMSVRSASSDEVLVDSGTDTRGEFDMELPAGEEALIVDVTGVGEAFVNRSQRGAGAITAKLKVNSAGALEASELFESQIDNTLLCEGVALNGDTVEITQAAIDDGCSVKISLASLELELDSFITRFLGKCEGDDVVLNQAKPDSAGAVTVSLDGARGRECSDLRIVITSNTAPGLVSVFPVAYAQ
jgi:hypothetical protein